MMAAIGRALRAKGYDTVALGYQSRSHSLDQIVSGLRPRISIYAQRASKLHFVAHSMGGLVVRALLTDHQPQSLGRVVMLGPPNQGSEWASLLRLLRLDRLSLNHAREILGTQRSLEMSEKLGEPDYTVGIIAGNRAIDPILPRIVLPKPNDGKVSVMATHLNGETDHIVLPVAHTAMLWNPRVHRQILAFLTDGKFTRQPEHGA
jgi:pimeloyl-ACP methyl ester carboxylesterase